MAQTAMHFRSSFSSAAAGGNRNPFAQPTKFALIAMQINGNMVVLAREIRGMTQQYLASRMAMSLYALSRIERGIQGEVADQQALAIANTLEFPLEFLRQRDDLPETGSSPCCAPGGKPALDEFDQKRIRGVLKVLRFNFRQMLTEVEVVAERVLPGFAYERSAGSSGEAARALRAFWKVADGPVANLTALIEGAGVVVVRCDFGMTAVGATSIRPDGSPPLVLVDRNVSGDQSRMMLAHQLAHLVMHQAPGPGMEREAEEFAHELLLPEAAMQAAFARPAEVTLADLASLKTRWNVPIAVLLERAHALKLIDTGARNRLWMNAKIRGYLAEPHPLPNEEGRCLPAMLDCFARARGLGAADLARTLKIGARDIAAWYGRSLPYPGGAERAGPANTPGAASGATIVRRVQRRGAATDLA